MKKEILVYLSGGIKKGHDDQRKFFWNEKEKKELVSEMTNTSLIQLDPALRTDDLGDMLSILGRDMLQVLISDAVLVDARTKRGVGVGAEIDRAETQNIPVIAIVPEDTAYHKFDTTILDQHIDEWKHPFIFGYTSFAAKTFAESGKWIDQNLAQKKECLPNDISDRILGAMQHYIHTQLMNDLPMKKMYEEISIVKDRIDFVTNKELAYSTV
ncbi:MAG: hypothetical protein K0T99_00375 [Alphaproteobacteria bacterium]|nr:hypothetical protein [Alphaproteobacteria bacterium]